MRKTFTYLSCMLLLFVFDVIDINAQIPDSVFVFSSSEEDDEEEIDWTYAHTFTITNAGSSAGSYHPMSAESFGIVCEYTTGGTVLPWTVNKDMLLTAQQTEFWKKGVDIKLTPNFLAYDCKKMTFRAIDHPGNGLTPTNLIFCWVMSKRIYYCCLNFRDIIYKENDGVYYANFVFDVYNNPYGVLYYDL
ncbi:MAG: hypothetical protein NC206_11540 [Bacteroides sp.]|nr:hypothetical protein [Roseburia sp.]MCM1347700.1 hypothetical protein [Bacteroides sp.]MCM1422120.1 hypothetical protein [Bacteroides sp.]